MNRLLAGLTVLWTCTAPLLAAEPNAPSAAKAPPRPNVVFILADDLGFSDVGCYGGEIETPRLDGLARDGVRFTQFHNCARCWPTRAALLTGYYPQQIHRDALPGVAGGSQGVRQPWAKLLPAMLAPAGYRSYHSGKWHIDGPVLAGGFVRSLNTKNDGNFFTAKGNSIDDRPVVPAADETGYYATIAVVDHAISCLDEHAEKYPHTPFFQYLPFIAPHFPLHALPEDIAKYRDKYLAGWEAMREGRFARQKTMGIVNTSLSALEPDVGPPYAFPDAMKKLGPGETNRPLPWSELTDEQRRFQATKMAIHAAMVDRMDREIGRYLDRLKSLNLDDNTLIMFASDNGASAEIMVRNGGHDPAAAPGSAASYLCLGPGFSSACNTPFRRHKTWVHEGGTSTPLIVRWPRGIAAKNELRHTPAHAIDFVPTVLELAGIERPAPATGETVSALPGGETVPALPGKSLVPALAADVTIPRECLWWLHEGNKAVRVGDMKLTAAKGEPWALYDLKTDRAEQHDLSARFPERVKELDAIWQSHTDRFVEIAKQSPSPAPKKGNKNNEKASPEKQ